MATYKEIQAHIKNELGISVKSCWIAHVKELCGIKTRTAPNRKDLSMRIAPCPPDKVDVIKNAFRYFGILTENK